MQQQIYNVKSVHEKFIQLENPEYMHTCIKHCQKTALVINTLFPTQEKSKKHCLGFPAQFAKMSRLQSCDNIFSIIITIILLRFP